MISYASIKYSIIKFQLHYFKWVVERASLGVGGLVHKKVYLARPFNFLQVFCFIYTFLSLSNLLFFTISKSTP